MASSSVSVLKFVGTVSLGLLTGVSYTVSSLTLPSLLHLPSSSSAAHALASLTASLRLPLLTLSSLASAPLLISFFLSPRNARHPYLVYTSLLTVLSVVTPAFLLPSATIATPAPAPARKPVAPRQRQQQRSMEASYEVLGDLQSEPASEEEIEEQQQQPQQDVNGEDLRAQVETIARGYAVRGGIAALGFAMAVVGIWGDGAPQAVVYAS